MRVIIEAGNRYYIHDMTPKVAEAIRTLFGDAAVPAASLAWWASSNGRQTYYPEQHDSYQEPVKVTAKAVSVVTAEKAEDLRQEHLAQERAEKETQKAAA